MIEVTECCQMGWTVQGEDTKVCVHCEEPCETIEIEHPMDVWIVIRDDEDSALGMSVKDWVRLFANQGYELRKRQ